MTHTGTLARFRKSRSIKEKGKLKKLVVIDDNINNIEKKIDDDKNGVDIISTVEKKVVCTL